MRNGIFHGLAALVLMTFSFAAAADNNLRCGSKLIKTGMTSAEVLKYCGEPAEREVEDQDVRSGGRVVGKTQLHRWTYTHYGATRVLEFDQDKLMSIK